LLLPLWIILHSLELFHNGITQNVLLGGISRFLSTLKICFTLIHVLYMSAGHGWEISIIGTYPFTCWYTWTVSICLLLQTRLLWILAHKSLYSMCFHFSCINVQQ
jgi:hypothetical protein